MAITKPTRFSDLLAADPDLKAAIDALDGIAIHKDVSRFATVQHDWLNAPGRFYAEHPALLLLGRPGTGKTSQALHVLRYVCGRSPFTPWRIVRPLELLGLSNGDRHDLAMDARHNVDLMIIDDLAEIPQTPATRSLLAEVIDTRFMRRLPTVYVCGLPLHRDSVIERAERSGTPMTVLTDLLPDSAVSRVATSITVDLNQWSAE